MSRRVNTISEVSENIKSMDELLENYKGQELSRSDQETLQVNALPQVILETENCEDVWDLLSNDVKHFLPQTLFQRCEKLRPLLFRLASETVDDDEALGKSHRCPCISLQLNSSTFALTSGVCPSLGGGMLQHLLPSRQSFPFHL